jgi:uncharacterized RDD family membrane protein YckC
MNRSCYAGFWKRLAALLIDGLVFIPVGILLSLLLVNRTWSLLGNNAADFQNQAYIDYVFSSLSRQTLFCNLFSAVISWFYFSIMESSSKQATLGKLAVGIKVTDLCGDRLSFARATGRYFAKIINSFTLCIGYLMAAFTQRKQGLHDMIAGTLVINKEYGPAYHQSSSYAPPQRKSDSNRETSALRLGYPMAPDDATVDVVCPKCQMINNSNSIFCACCGDELKENTARFSTRR